MRRPILLFLALTAVAGATLTAENWPHWRGPLRNGVSTEKNLPTTWSATQNVAWKLPLPAFSGSTPIVWDDRVFLNVATERATGHIELWAIDRNKQAVAWRRRLAAENRLGRKQNMSSPSPVTDGKHVWAMTGTGVLKGFDFAGTELWTRDLQKDYGKFGIQFGYASSPLLHGDALYLQVLHGFHTDDPSYVLKIDKVTGKTVWRTERPTDAVHESPDSYTTPALLQHNGKTEIVITGGDLVTGHDPVSGKELWRADVLNPNKARNYRIISSPIVAGGLIIAPTRVNPLVALRPGGSGDIASTHVAWTFHRGPDVPSPVSDGKYLYLVSEQGVVYCLEVATGALVYGPNRIPNDFYSSSPVLADGKIYVTGESTGVTTVFRAGPNFEILASNTFDDPCAPYCLASIAVSQGQLFIRTDANLWVIGERKR
ncbi:MAG TPA: PQQ-binding-like beta-propeller repeat protein [Vicinamibacterales bacterium]|nr:PQQ-binding-like beta-propeller repeat protein [Vicinamibacterales bacterium]